MRLKKACQFHVASFWLLPASFDVFMPPPTINAAQIPSILRHISVNSGAEAVFKSNCFEFHGLESEVRAAVQLVLELDFVKVGARARAAEMSYRTLQTELTRRPWAAIPS